MIATRAQAAWPALGMTVVVEVPDEAALPEARRIAERELAAADDAYSPVRDDTELAALHAAGGRPMRVGPHLLGAVEVAVAAARATGGAVDAAGVLRLTPVGSRLLRRERRSGWRGVHCDRSSSTIRLDPGVRLDLGATGKALIADRAARRIATAAGGALVAVGGDVATAGSAPAGGWLIRVTDDHRDTEGGELVRIESGALATSSVAVRLTGAGVHIVDPRAGRPAAGPWRTVSVTATTCVEANTASTAAIVLGDRAPHWLARGGLPARLVGHDGSMRRVAGWPEAWAP